MNMLGSDRGVRPDPGNPAMRGAVLIGLAVVIGIALLQVVDDVPKSGVAATPTGPTSSTVDRKVLGRPTNQVRIQVLNGSGIAGNARDKSNVLKSLGYSTIDPGDTATQAGSTLACKKGFEKEQFFLKITLDNKQIPVSIVPFPAPAPSAAKVDQIDCLVVLGT